jgi:glycosyltransferase involved in cell wall biosynthesis
MRVALDISPLSAGHAVRGVGFYLSQLYDALGRIGHSDIAVTGCDLKDIKAATADLIHIPFFDPFRLHLPFSFIRKTVVTVHDLTPIALSELFPVGIRGKVTWQIQRFLLHRCRGIITDTQSAKEQILRYAGVPSDKIAVALLAPREHIASPSTSSEVRAKYQLPKRYALYVGDVTPNKNLKRIVDAALKTNIPLILAGKSLVLTDELEHPWHTDHRYVLDMNKKFPSLVRTIGFVDDKDLPALYRNALCCVFPSLSEGFGLPILEAMQYDCPVITSQTGATAEVARDAAVLVDPINTEAIANAIQLIASDPGLRKKLILKGNEISKQFTWKKTATQTLDAYRYFFART